MKPLLVLNQEWEKAEEIVEMRKRFGYDGIVFSLRMMIDIAKGKDRQIVYNVDIFNNYMNEFGYNKEELRNLLDFSINQIELFHKVKEGEKVWLKCPLMEDKYLFKTKKK